MLDQPQDLIVWVALGAAVFIVAFVLRRLVPAAQKSWALWVTQVVSFGTVAVALGLIWLLSWARIGY